MYLDYTPDQVALRDRIRATMTRLMTAELRAEIHATEGGGPLYLQAMAEKRKGGETGIAEIRCVEGDAVWQDKFWSRDLLDAALKHRVNQVPKNNATPQAIFVKYRDGVKASILNLNSHSRDYLFAAREKSGKTHASCFYIQLYNHNHWGFMVKHFEDLVLTKKSPYPPERTLLSNGIMLAGLESRLQNQQWLPTPYLDIRY